MNLLDLVLYSITVDCAKEMLHPPAARSELLVGNLQKDKRLAAAAGYKQPNGKRFRLLFSRLPSVGRLCGASVDVLQDGCWGGADDPSAGGGSARGFSGVHDRLRCQSPGTCGIPRSRIGL